MRRMTITIGCLLLGIVLSSCASQAESSTQVLINGNVINQQNFLVAANEIGLETETQGAVFVIGANASQMIGRVLSSPFLKLKL